MAINIKNPEIEKSIRELASKLNVGFTEAVGHAVNQELSRTNESLELRLARMRVASDRISALPLRDSRSAEEILGYDEHGLPK